MRRRYAVVAGVVTLVGAGGASALWLPSASSIDADERALIEQVESEAHGEGEELARFVDENIAILLSEDVADEVDGSRLASLFDMALSSDARSGVFERVVSAVGEEGAIHSPEVRAVFGNAAAAQISWFDAQISAPFLHADAERHDEVRRSYQDARGFLEEVMRDPAVAEQLRQSMADYGLAEVAAAPHAGEARGSRLAEIGRIQEVFTEAHHAAEVREARLDGNVGAVEEAREAYQERLVEDAVSHARWVALDRLASDPTVRAEAVGEPFVDASGALKRDLTESEAEALDAWATNQGREGGVIFDDVGSIQRGVGQIVSSG